MTEQPAAPAEGGPDTSGWGGQGTAEGRRIVALLWDPPEVTTGRGPRAKLTLAEVVAAGMAEADESGLAALSIRRVAKRLGIAAMSVYTYVPGRSELVELMIDAAYAEFSLPDPALGWRERLSAHVEQSWLMLRRHPWLLDYNVARMPVGPHVLDVEEALYAALATAGLGPADVVNFSNLIGWHLRGMARAFLADSEEERRTGVSAEAYWEARNSFWATYFDPGRYPNLLWIWEAGVFDDPEQASYDAAVPRMLAAVMRLIEDRLKAG